MKLPKKYFHVVMAIFMAFFMGGCMSGIVTFINIGLVDDFLQRWGTAFVFAFFIALPLALLFTPIASKIAENLTE